MARANKEPVVGGALHARQCSDYPGMITGYLGQNWGVGIGILYFVMLVIWVFVYSTTVTNDSASFFS